MPKFNEYVHIETEPGNYIKIQVFNTPEPGSGSSLLVKDLTSFVPYIQIVEIRDIYVSKDSRLKGIGSTLLQIIKDKYENAIIVVAVRASGKEYEKEPNNAELIKIIEEIIPFYEKNGFENVNDLFGSYQFRTSMLYTGNTWGDFVKTKINEYRENKAAGWECK